MNRFSSMDEVQRWLFQILLEEGLDVSPRGESTLELSPTIFTLERPRYRCITSQARRWNMALAVGEFAWHMSASKDVDFVAYYMNRWRQFVDDPTQVRGGCYGYRVFGEDDGQNQWGRVIHLLQIDPNTRRAVLNFHDPSSVLDPCRKDVSCACTLQFLLRGGRLDAIGHMRSNDAVWGLPYDVFFHSMLQELAAVILGVELGAYTHFVGSMHIYARHLEMAREVLASNQDAPMEMQPLDSPDSLGVFLEGERSIRASGRVQTSAESLSDFWLNLLDVVTWHRSVKFPNEMLSPLVPDGPYSRLTWSRTGATQSPRP